MRSQDEFFLEIKKFIKENSKTDSDGIALDTPLISSGLVDSLLLAELIIYVENSLGVEIDIDDFQMKSFETIEKIYVNYCQPKVLPQ